MRAHVHVGCARRRRSGRGRDARAGVGGAVSFQPTSSRLTHDARGSMASLFSRRSAGRPPPLTSPRRSPSWLQRSARIGFARSRPALTNTSANRSTRTFFSRSLNARGTTSPEERAAGRREKILLARGKLPLRRLAAGSCRSRSYSDCRCSPRLVLTRSPSTDKESHPATTAPLNRDTMPSLEHTHSSSVSTRWWQKLPPLAASIPRPSNMSPPFIHCQRYRSVARSLTLSHTSRGGGVSVASEVPCARKGYRVGGGRELRQ